MRPHTPSSVGGTSYVYDANGNLTSGAGRTYTWSIDNLPASVSQTSGTENYSYDADGERVKVVRGSTTTVYLEGLWEEVAGGAAKSYYTFTVYLEGLWEEVVGGAAKSYYTFNGQVVAVRDRSTNVDLSTRRPPQQCKHRDDWGRRARQPVGVYPLRQPSRLGRHHTDYARLYRAAAGRHQPVVLSCPLL